jgi:signal transduction histidine kinase
MKTPVRLLHLEDDPADAQLILSALQHAGLPCEVIRVAGSRDYSAALEQGKFDLILADYQLPGFDGLAALAMARERRADVPFLFVSGFIGEEVALHSLKTGATDYVFKHNLARLAPAIRRALQEAREHREREQAEAALQEREAVLRSFYDAAPFMMGIVEPLPDDLLHLSANAASAKFLGTTPDAMRRCRSSDLGIPLEVISGWLEHLRQAQRLGRPVEFEQASTRESQTRCLTITVSGLPATPGQPPRFCYVAEDITDKRQLEQQFLRAQRLESVGTLASGLAHDLNNVLAPILMALHLFRLKLTDAEDQELLGNLESTARRGADIIRQVLTFARGVEGTRQPLRLKPLVNDVAMMLRDTFPRSIKIQTRVPDDLWNVSGDATQIYQVLMNLCLNGRDAMPAGGRLLIAGANAQIDEAAARLHPGSKAGQYVVLTVADNGTGIAPEMLNKIFDPFFTTKEVGKGTGLGLSTVLSIVKSHGGFVTTTSEPGRGSEFKVHLPGEPRSALLSAEAAAASIERGTSELILVVDDETAIRQVTSAALEGHGYRVVTARDGPEALALFDRHKRRIQLVITDMMMPRRDGASLIQTLLSLAPRLKIIAVSGLVEAAPSPAPGVAFLQKPFAAEKLLQAVHEALHPSVRPALAKGGGDLA